VNSDELIAGRQLALVDFDDTSYDKTGSYAKGRPDLLVRDVAGANLITSLMPGIPLAPAGGVHKPVIDIDLPAQLVPSSTPGHYHLYLDVEVPWDAYVDLLEALAAAGIVEHGYVSASIARGYTAVRPPWVRKPAPMFKEAAK
jgi:hypothetical protein